MRLMKLLFVGDINVDLMLSDFNAPPREDKEVMANKYLLTLGSQAIIAALAYNHLGGQSSVCGLAGEDDYSRFILESLTTRGVDVSLVDIDPETPTGFTINLIISDKRTQITYPGTIVKFKGPNLNRKEYRYFDHIHFSGIYQQLGFLPHLAKTMAFFRANPTKIKHPTP